MELTVDDKKAYAYTGGKAFDPQLPTIVFIHGGEQDHSAWGLQSRYFANHGFSVLALDLPGHGRSAGAALTCIEDMADWVVALLDAADVGSATLVGHSMGSLIALECAGRYPKRVNHLALLSVAFPMRVSPELLQMIDKNEAAAHDMINIWSHAAFAHYPSSPGPGFWVPGVNLRLMQRQRPGVLHADFTACNNYTAGLERAREVRCPTLVVLAQRDWMTPTRAAREIVKTIEGARVVSLTGSGHNVMAERPDQVLDELAAFLSGLHAGQT